MDKAELIGGDGSRYELTGEQVAGRSADCDIVVDDAKVSRRHAVFRLLGDNLSVEDLGSANGTLVNDLRISAPTNLAHGDRVTLDKHVFSVEFSGASVAEDATVVNLPEEDATVLSIPEAVSEPSPEPVAGEADLPGSWVDGGTADHTQVMGFEETGAVDSATLERRSDLAHLLLVNASGAAGDTIELQPSGGAEPDVWEIGREDSCEVALDEPTVSARHAQLVHNGGRWSLVNLVSSNGIFVNGEKRLKAFLSDGDELRLGKATLMFYAARGAAAAAPKTAKPAMSEGAGGPAKQGSGRVRYLLIAVLLAVLAGAAYLLL